MNVKEMEAFIAAQKLKKAEKPAPTPTVAPVAPKKTFSFREETQNSQPAKPQWDVEIGGNEASLPTVNNRDLLNKAFRKVSKIQLTEALSQEDIVIPNGHYIATVTSWKMFAAKDPKNLSNYITIKFKIIDGEYVGTTQTLFVIIFKKDGGLNAYGLSTIINTIETLGCEFNKGTDSIGDEIGKGLDAIIGKNANIDVVWGEKIANEKQYMKLTVESLLG